MIFETESGSTYEVDTERKRVRRLNGKTPGTARIGTDGQWKTYEEIGEPRIGLPVGIIWGADVEPIDPDTNPHRKMTVTSPVVAVTA